MNCKNTGQVQQNTDNMDAQVKAGRQQSNGEGVKKRDCFLNYSSKSLRTGVKLRSGGRARRDARLRYSASDIETLKKRYALIVL